MSERWACWLASVVAAEGLGVTAPGGPPAPPSAVRPGRGCSDHHHCRHRRFLRNFPAPTLPRPHSYVDKAYAKAGTALKVNVRGKLNDATVTKMPFVPTHYHKPPQ